MVRQLPLTKILRAADQIIELANSESGHVLACFLGNSVEEIYNVIDLAFELGAVLGILRSNSNRAVVEVTTAHIDATHRNKSDGSKVEFFCPKNGGVDDIKPGPESAIGPQGNAVTKTVHHEDLLGFRNSDLPGESGVLDRTERRSARSTIVSGNENDVGIRLRDSGCDRSHSCFGD